MRTVAAHLTGSPPSAGCELPHSAHLRAFRNASYSIPTSPGRCRLRFSFFPLRCQRATEGLATFINSVRECAGAFLYIRHSREQSTPKSIVRSIYCQPPFQAACGPTAPPRECAALFGASCAPCQVGIFSSRRFFWFAPIASPLARHSLAECLPRTLFTLCQTAAGPPPSSANRAASASLRRTAYRQSARLFKEIAAAATRRCELSRRLGPARCASYMRSDFLLSSTFFRFFSRHINACEIPPSIAHKTRPSPHPSHTSGRIVNHFLTLFHLGLTKPGWPATLPFAGHGRERRHFAQIQSPALSASQGAPASRRQQTPFRHVFITNPL